MPSTRKLKLVVLGMMGRCPFGGQTWLYLNWLRGLARLGHEVWYVEDDATWPYDPRADAISGDPAYAVEYLGRVLAQVGLSGRWAYRALWQGADACHGLTRPQLLELYRTCDAILNVCGATVLNEDHQLAPRRVYVETDPVGNQLELAVFVRRIDTGITLSQPRQRAYTLSHALAGTDVGASYARVPVGEDNSGRPTLNGTPQYSSLRVLDVEPLDQGVRLRFAKNTPAGLLAALRQPGQKLIDNTGEVYTVAKADDIDRSGVVLEQPVPPDVILRIERDGFQLSVLATPQIPAAAAVLKVSQ